MEKNNLKKVSIVFVAFIIVFSSIILFIHNKPYVIILNNYAAGRLGDQIIGYSKAKWLSYKYNIPFRLIPFANNECLNLSNEQHYTSISYFLNRVFYKIFGRIVWVDSEKDLVDGLAQLKGPTRFIAHINTRFYEHIDCNAGLDKYDYAWVSSGIYEIMVKYSDFAQKLKEMIQPLKKSYKITLSKNIMTVAVHIRKGGGFDLKLIAKQYYKKEPELVKYEQFYIKDNDKNSLQYISKNIPSFSYDLANRDSADTRFLDKFPPEQYYVKQIRNLSDFLGNIPMYIYIFTDDQNPLQLMDRIKKAVDKPNIIFDCRKGKNSHDTNVLYDLYAMANFDCLIRSGSSFAYISQLIGDHKIIIYPLHVKWIDSKILFVDRVGVIVRNQELSSKKFGA